MQPADTSATMADIFAAAAAASSALRQPRSASGKGSGGSAASPGAAPGLLSRNPLSSLPLSPPTSRRSHRTGSSAAAFNGEGAAAALVSSGLLTRTVERDLHIPGVLGEDGEVEGAGGAHYASQSPLTHFFAGEEEGVSMVTGQNAMGAVSSLLQKQRHHALHASAFN